MIDTIRLLVRNTPNPENGVILASIDADGIFAPYGDKQPFHVTHITQIRFSVHSFSIPPLLLEVHNRL